METMTVEEYLRLYKKDYGPFLINTKAIPLNPLHGIWHMDKRKVVDLESNTVTLYDATEKEAQWEQKAFL